MWIRRWRSLPVLLVALLFAPLGLGAQERIALRAVPRPNQVIRLSMSQDMAFDVVIEGAGVGPMKVEGKMMMAGTQKVGAPDTAGRVTAELSFDQVTMDMRLNGSPAPAGAGAGAGADQLIGKVFTVVYDAQGKVVEFTAPPEMGEMGSNAKQMISSLSGSIPSVTLAIGDTVTVPLSIPLPIPIPGNAGAPINIESKTTSKLVAIGRDGSDRVATLEQQTEAAMAQPVELPGPNGPMSAHIDMRMTGTGSTQLNVDKGFIKAGHSDLKVEMTMLMQGMTIKLNGTIRMEITGTSAPPQ